MLKNAGMKVPSEETRGSISAAIKAEDDGMQFTLLTP